MEKQSIKKYLFVICRCGEDETYLFDTIEDLLKFWNCKDIEELLDKSSIWSTYTVYEVNKIWSNENGK